MAPRYFMYLFNHDNFPTRALRVAIIVGQGLRAECPRQADFAFHFEELPIDFDDVIRERTEEMTEADSIYFGTWVIYD